LQEIYLGIDTMSSYETVRQLQSDDTIIAIGVGGGFSVLGLMLVVAIMKGQMFEIFLELLALLLRWCGLVAGPPGIDDLVLAPLGEVKRR
jgi:hypothetical protein